MQKWQVYASAATLCLLTSPVLWIASARLQQANGQRAALEYLPHGGVLTPDDQLLLERLSVRRGFLHAALEHPENAQAFRDQEHRWSIALSRVRAEDARALFRDELRDRILTSDDSAALRVAVSLTNRWDIAPTLSPGDREDFASQIASRMLETHNPDVLAPLAGELFLLSSKDFHTPPAIASKLLDYLQREPSAQAKTAIFEGILALSPGLDEPGADALAAQLTLLMEQDSNSSALSLWTAGLKAVGAKLSPRRAGETALRIAKRMAVEPDPGLLRTLASPFPRLGSRLEQTEAAAVESEMVPRILGEINVGRLYPLTGAFSAIAPRAGAADAENFGAQLLSRMRIEPSTEVISLLATAMGALGKSLPVALAEQAAGRIGSRMAQTHESSELAELANALAAFKGKVNPAHFEEGSRILAEHLPGKRNAHEVATLASALSLLVEPVDTGKAAEFARLVMRLMSQEHDPAVLLRLSTGLVALAPRLDEHTAAELTRKLVLRMEEETGSDALRTLSFSIGAFAKHAGKETLDHAGDLVARQMSGQSDPNVLRDLVSALIALGDDAREAHTPEALSKLVRQIALQEAADALINLSESTEGLLTQSASDKDDEAGEKKKDDKEDRKAVPSDAPAQAARILIGRMLRTHDASVVRRLNLVMHPIDQVLSPEATSEFVPQLAATIAGAQDADLRRSLGEVLGDLPVDNMSAEDFEHVRSVFELPNAPCRIALGTGSANRTAELVRGLLNPMCSETSWTSLAAAMGRGIITGQQDDNEALAFFHQLIVDDDDGERNLEKEPAPKELHVDFNKLSEILRPLRKAGLSSMWHPLEWACIVIAALGLLLAALAFRERARSKLIVNLV